MRNWTLNSLQFEEHLNHTYINNTLALASHLEYENLRIVV